VVRLDARSRVLWSYRGGAHHDLFLHPAGELWVLDRRAVRLPRINPEEHVLEDLVTVLDPDNGAVIRQISILEALERSPFAHLLEAMPRRGDLLHTNTLKLLGEEAREVPLPGFRPGNLLLSVLTIDALAVLDPDRGEVVWAATGPWRRQHEPVLLAGGRILLFDNLGLGDRSRVIEIEAVSTEVVWSYPERPNPELLFSRTLGASRRLPNGNTLITESENGRALEVTAEGEVVWEFYTPHRAGDGGELVATLFEVSRVSAEQPWLAPSGRRRR
jgi:hypothetical protein